MKNDRDCCVLTSGAPFRIAQAASGAVGLLGLTVILAWHWRIGPLLQAKPGYVAVQYLTALGFVAGAGGMYAFLRGSRRVCLWCGTFVGGLGLVLILEHLTAWDLGIQSIVAILPRFPGQQPTAPAISTAVSFFIFGGGLAALGGPLPPLWKCRVMWMAGAVLSATSAMAVIGYLIGLPGTYAWGHFTGMAIQTAVGMLLLSIGLMATRLAISPRRHWSGETCIPVAAGVMIATASVILWQALRGGLRRTASATAQAVAESIKVDVTERLEFRLRALERMADRWSTVGGTPEFAWRKDAGAYLRQEKIFLSLQWVDAGLVVRWAEPDSAVAAIVGFDLRKDSRWPAGQKLSDALGREGTMVVSPTITLKQGGQGIIVYYPVTRQGVPDGFIAGVISTAVFAEDVLSEARELNRKIAVFEDGKQIFGPVFPAYLGEVPGKATVSFAGRNWAIIVSTTDILAHEKSGRLPDLILASGLILSLAMAWVIRGRQTSHLKAAELEGSMRMLEEETRQRLSAEAARWSSEQRLRVVLESATGVSVIATDQEGIITYFSKGAEELLGYASEEMVGHHTPAVIHLGQEVAERGQELSAELGQSVEGFEVFVALAKTHGYESRQWTYVRKDGAHRIVQLIVTVLKTSDGRIDGFLGTALDISELKELEGQLRQAVSAEKAAHSLLEAAGRIARLGHWELMSGEDRPFWSSVTREIHEVPAGEQVTLDAALAFFSSEDQTMVQSAIQQSLTSGIPFEFEAKITTRGGHPLWTHSRGEPIFGADGEVIGLRGVFQDVNDRHKAGELLTLRNQQLEEATRRATELARAKADFLANMSHEIRTPLNAVIGMSDLLSATELTDRQTEFVDTIRTSGDILLALINDILDFSKIEAGRLELESLPVDLHECIESVFDLVSPLARRKKLDLLYWVEPNVPGYVLGDITRLRQILVNLVANGVKFTSAGEILVKVSRITSGEGGDLLKFSVRDTGIGIPKDRQQRLFQAFSQVDSSTTRRFGGTGLGLAICSRLVSIMKGRIRVESEEGSGADFIFEIPCAPAGISTPTIYQRGTVHELDGLRVLVVDDNATNRWILNAQISAWGMMVRETGDPAEALEWIERGDPFDAAILDGHMLGMTGYDLAARLRQPHSKRAMPILILTSMAEDKVDAVALGISEIITKPVKTGVLYETMRRLLLGKRATRQHQQASAEEGSLLASEIPLKILVAEDNPINQRVITLLLEKLGYKIELAGNGLEVLAALKRSSFDVVLMDVQMPEMDGLETSREICDLYPREHRPHIIALTADASNEDRELCLASGMNDYLSKPVRSNKVAEALRQAYNVKSGIV